MTGNSDSTSKSHATGDSIVPEPLQKILPESVEKAVPNAIHDTGNASAKEAYQADKEEAKIQKEVKKDEHNI